MLVQPPPGPIDHDRTVLARVTGLPLEQFREEHLATQLQRALAAERVADARALASRLAVDPVARARLRRALAVSVTGPFRDPEQFRLLERELLPPLLAQPGRVRVWSVGCSDGSELVSVGTVLERLGGLERAYLLGSDLLEENLALARGRHDGASTAVRARLRWEQRDVVAAAAPPGRWDLVLCRNVAIYLTAPARERLHRTLARALAPGGVLLLGRSERLAEPAAHGLEPAGPHAYRSCA